MIHQNLKQQQPICIWKRKMFVNMFTVFKIVNLHIHKGVLFCNAIVNNKEKNKIGDEDHGEEEWLFN